MQKENYMQLYYCFVSCFSQDFFFTVYPTLGSDVVGQPGVQGRALEETHAYIYSCLGSTTSQSTNLSEPQFLHL